MLKLYRCVFSAISPILRTYFYSRCLYGKDKIESVKNHFGYATIDRPAGKLIWVHAASIGESTSALTFIQHIKKQFPDLNVLITTITVTSAEILEKKIKNIPNCYHQFCVADNIFWVRRFLDHWKPDVAVFLESEIWANTIDELYRRKIPSFLLNARLSPRSFERWKFGENLLRETLGKFSKILAQSEVDRERYSFFSPTNTIRIDNLKYANALLPCNKELFGIFEKICSDKIVFVAASTHDKEEEVILQAHERLKKKFGIDNLVTIIIPRHLTRVKDVCDLIKKHRLLFSLRSEISETSEESKDREKIQKFREQEVFCVDTFGEVGTFFRLAHICFVGGSLVPIGGHNIYEPVALGKPVLHGPHMENALEVRDFLTEQKVAFEVDNCDDICEIFMKLIKNIGSESSELKKIEEKALKITKNTSLQQIDEIMQLSKIFSEEKKSTSKI